MSIITAKFPSICASCRQPIKEGDKISWKKKAKSLVVWLASLEEVAELELSPHGG